MLSKNGPFRTSYVLHGNTISNNILKVCFFEKVVILGFGRQLLVFYLPKGDGSAKNSKLSRDQVHICTVTDRL